MKARLQVMKFGGTSVGDASCIARTAQIVAQAARENGCVAVVSAMSGVTNRLVEAAKNAQAGNNGGAAAVVDALRKQHEAALTSLIQREEERAGIRQKMEEVLAEGRRLCEGTALLRELTPRTLDAISSLGERLSAPLVAAAVRELGVPSESIEATELIVPDVTGFIGASKDGQLTTLGRGGSDYSATILGAAMDADEVIIWTDVDGVLTADPRLVPEARAIPVWIRNSLAPQRPGTKITPEGRSIGGGVKALTAIRDVTLISVGGPGIVGLPDVVGRTFSTTAEVRANVLLISQSSSQNDICFIVAAADAQRTVEALREEFAQDLAHHNVEHITVDSNIAIVAVVGENMRGIPGIAGRTFNALGRENVNIIAIAQGSSECNISFVIEEKAVKTALLATHREFGLNSSPS